MPTTHTRPSDGRAYYAGTKSNWRVSCLQSLKNGTGEGFLVVLPDGTRYTFDWISSRKVAPLKDRYCTTNYGCVDGFSMNRREYFIHATKVEDRFGNSVTYTYDQANPRLLTRIESNDGAYIAVNYIGGKATTVSSSAGTWSYAYSDTARTVLSSVQRPDGSSWRYQYDNLEHVSESQTRLMWQDCTPDTNAAKQDTAPKLYQAFTATHPSGATGVYKFRKLNHGLENTPGGCYDPGPDVVGDEQVSDIVAVYRVPSLYEKTVTGPGLSPMTWSYTYSSSWSWGNGGVPAPCTDPATGSRSTTNVTAPDGVVSRYAFGNDYVCNSGQLLQVQTIDQGVVKQDKQYSYLVNGIGQPFPEDAGLNPNPRDNAYGSQKNRPQILAVTQQDGATFTRRVEGFDPFVQPTRQRAFSSLGYERLDTTAYENNLGFWLLGQVQSQTTQGISPALTPVFQTARTDFTPQAQPWHIYAFNRPQAQQTLAYAADGALSSVTDARGLTTTLSNWKRTIPQSIGYADGTAMSAVVNDSGTIASVTTAAGSKTCYAYDSMSRLAQITYPSDTQAGVCDASKWNVTSSVFEQIAGTEVGVPAGHWRKMVTTGTGRHTTIFDALLRPVLEDSSDLAGVDNTRSMTYMQYNAAGRLAFKSYPTRTEMPFTSASQGMRTLYDALGRVTSAAQDSELGPLTTTTKYLLGLQTQVTNPRLKVTTTGYRAYDEPSYDQPIWVVQPEGAVTEINRDVFGKPLQLRRRNTDSSLIVDRNYVYDGYQQLCKQIEPESGATVMDYDAAGNMFWSAGGMSLPSTDPGMCETDRWAAYGSGRRIHRYYDNRNRLTSMQTPDHNGTQDWTYTAEGQPSQIITYNDEGNTAVVNRYAYNRRGMVTNEVQEQPGWYSWGINYGFNANAFLTSQSYADGFSVDFGRDALGQVTQVGGFALNVRHYANGAISSFTYGNGVVHTMEQNARLLPSRSSDAGGSPSPINSGYYYDANGNVTQVTEDVSGGYNRQMTYDGLDRLTAAGSTGFGGDGWHRFAYDAADNLKSWKLAGVKDYANYYYEPGTQRLTSIQNSAGATVVGFDYDAQGNQTNKNGQGYTFDLTNRLRGVTGKESYRYDAAGRRVLGWSPNGGTILSMYSQAGELTYDQNAREGKSTNHIYLSGTPLVNLERIWATGALLIKYQHTDALGTPVAVTNDSGTVLERTNYDPYGGVIGKPVVQGVGYTGHVMDAQTGLTYMQQRYYDPGIGRFLSVDPVAAYSKKGINFNRYWYASNNPYRFTDPDGRWVCAKGSASGDCANFESALTKASESAKSTNLSTSQQSRLQKAVAFYGEKGDSKVTVAFGPVKEGYANISSDRSGTGTVTFDLGKIGSRSPGEAGLVSGLAMRTLHEGDHGVWTMEKGYNSTKSERRDWERSGYLSEALYQKGSGFLQNGNNLWTPWNSGDGLDHGAIDAKAGMSVDASCKGATTGNCQ